VSLEQSDIKAGLGLVQVAPGLSIAYLKRFTRGLERPFSLKRLEQPPFTIAKNPFNVLGTQPKLEPDPQFFHILSPFLQLLEAAKLALTDSYAVPITNSPNLSNFRLECVRQLESLGTAQLFSAVRFLCAFDDSFNQILVSGHFGILQKY